MKKTLEKYSNPILYTVIFLFFWIVFWNIPLVKDGWCGQIYNSKSRNFMEWIYHSKDVYLTSNGRLIAYIFVGFFERNERMLDFANAVIMTVIIVVTRQVLFPKKKFFTVVIWTLFLLASVNIRTEVYFYATMIYLVPVLLFISFIGICQYFHSDAKIPDGVKFCIVCILGILNAGWIEHSGFAFVLVMGVCWLWNLIHNKRFPLKFFVFEFLNGITFCIMMLSPGLRAQRQIALPNDSIAWWLFYNLANTVQEIVYGHKMIFLFAAVVCIILMQQNCRKRKILFWVYEIMMALYAGVIFLNIVSESFELQLTQSLIMNANIWSFFGKFWMYAGIGMLVLIIFPIMYHSKKNLLVFIFSVGLLSLVPTIVTPNFSYRTCFFAFALLIFVIAAMMAEIRFYKRQCRGMFCCLISAVLLVQVDAYSIVLSNICAIQKEREKRIELVREQQLLDTWDDEKTLILPLFSADQLYGANPHPSNDVEHYNAFKQFYHLDAGTHIIFSDNRDELRVKLKNKEVWFELIPETADASSQYFYCILKNGETVWRSQATEQTYIRTAMPSENGSYSYMCEMVDEQGKTRIVYSAQVNAVNN